MDLQRTMPGFHIVTVNAGSSSVRLGGFVCPSGGSPELEVERHYRRGEVSARAALRELAATMSGQVDMVAHRVVHGGDHFTESCLLDAGAEHLLADMVDLAPLHNTVALTWIRAGHDTFGRHALHAAVFDTAFYAHMPKHARIYAIPQSLARDYGLFRYGFHGLAHRSMLESWRRLGEYAGDRIISFQLGAGCSVTASRDGSPVDTSMGFSPLEGLVMATRSGDVDPALVLHLQRHAGLGPEVVERLLNEHSGLLGLSGESSEMPVLLASARTESKSAVELYCQRAKKYLGAFLATLGGADAILFGGGVGEGSAEIRRWILADMEWAGIILDDGDPDHREGAYVISAPRSPVTVAVTPVDEASILAEEGQRLLRYAALPQEVSA